MKKNGSAHIMHLVMLALFAALLWIAYMRVRFVIDRKRKKEAETFTSHVVDSKKAAQFKQAKHLALKAQKLRGLNEEQKEQLADWHNRIEHIEKELLNPSPALAFLGPLGTAGVVMKENKLEQQLIILLNHIIAFMHDHKSIEGELNKSNNLDESLKTLQSLF